MDKPLSLFDTRTAARHISRGLITEEERQAHIDALEDCAELGEDSTVVFLHSLPFDKDSD